MGNLKMNTMKPKKLNPILVKIHKDFILQAEGLYAWVVDNNGKLIEKKAVKEGQAQLKTERWIIRGKARIYIAPEFPKALERRRVTEALLQKVGAYQPPLKIREGNVLEIVRIPDIEHFRFRFCNITGTVSKTFNIDGVNQVLPVCNVRVHICEVDPIWFILPKIPDLEIIDIRDRLIDVIIKEKFPPRPIPEPIPIPDPIGPISKFIKTPLSRAILKERREMQPLSLPMLEDEVISGLTSTSLEIVRKTLQKNYLALRPYLCLFPKRWPFLYRCDEIATVYPDCNGRFDHLYFYLESGDKPDIYIWVEANINGSWETVYKPSFSCGTHWDYACGTDINIRVSDERIGICECAPMPGEVVWMKRINNGISMRNIQQHSGSSGHLANAIGLTKYSTGDNVSPFGNSFPFVVQFGSGFPSANVTHYRWKYRQLKDAGLNDVSDTEKTFDGLVYKGYTYERVNSDGDTVCYSGSFQLGPFPSPGGPMFRIPHVEASDDVPSEPTAEWNQDTHSVHINSLNLNDGLYEFTMELLDDSGNVVPLDKDVFVVDKKAGEVSNPPDAPTITAFGRPENYLLLNATAKATGFKFVMRIDNDPCYADIKDALVDGTATHSECGFGQYSNKTTSQVTLKFEASHPRDFARYGFSVVKGNGNSAGPTNTSGYVTQAHHGYAVVSDVYFKNVPVADMLGSCDQAAFAENLHVWATHTNGNRRLDEYDRHDVAAFAIEPD